jgi:polygalacturonase
VSTAKVPMASFHGNDSNAPSELFQVISSPGGLSAGQSWTVIRGAEGTTPVAHAAGFTVNLVASAGDLGGTMPVYNVRAWPFNAPAAGGTADTGDGTAIQAALTACDANGGGIVYVPQGVYVCAQTLQIGSNTTLLGAGMGVSTIRQASSFNPAHVGGNQGLDLLITINNSGGVNIALSNLTFDGNQAGTPSMPGGFSAVQSYHLYLNSVTNLSIEAVEIINSIGYAVMVQNCEYFRVSRCHIVQGQAALGYNQQDGIHMTGSRFGTVTDNNIDTGVVTLVGDDCICVQSVSPDKPCTDVTIKGNVLRSGTRAVSVVLAGGACSDIDITGNTVYGTINDGFVINYGVAGSPVATSINFTGNVLANISSGGSNCGINLQSVNSGLGAGTGNGWQDVTITGNGFYNIQASGSFAVAATGGTGLTIEGNTMDLMNVFTAILVGNNNAGASSPVTNFSVTGNIINMSTSAGSSPNAILLQDSHDGTVSGNTLIGGNQATSQAVNLQGVGAAVTGVTVTGNRCTGWTTAVAEVNSGAAPDFNVIHGNNTHGCTNAVTVLGGHTLTQPNVMDVGGITDTEQFMALTAAYTLGAGTALQKLLNATANGALTVPALTSFFFECEFDLTGMSSTTGTLAFGFGGTATLTSVKYIAYAQKSAAIATPATAQVTVANVATAVPLVATSVTTTGSAYITGIVRVNAAGTLIPSVALSVGIAAVVGVNSWFRIVPVGPNTVTSAGNWS